MEKIRIDKWLWSVRIFKTRSIAANACRSGAVQINGKKAKAASTIIKGHLILVSKNGFNLSFKVKQLIDKRVSATLAKESYEDLTPDDELNKFKNWFVGKGHAEKRERGSGRPTKKNRREIELFKEVPEYDFED